MKIRGAPAIGIAAAMGIALAAQEIEAKSAEEWKHKLESIYTTFLKTRPTAVNIRWTVERLRNFLSNNKDMKVQELKAALIEEANAILSEDIEVNKSIGRWGAAFIQNGDTIITHCNAGSLATGGYGTATAPIREAIRQGKQIRVIVDETRPVLQGARLTAWELMEDGIDVTLIVDSAAATLIKKGDIDLAIVGTDRTTKNGDVANKIGTYPLAVLCHVHGVPFYVAAPLSSIDFTINSGELIEIEERAAEEVTQPGGQRIAPQGVKVKNIAFDVTPARLVSAFFTEKGAFLPSDLKKLSMKDMNYDEIRISKEPAL
jgi:methylthioribose-1-phosphate isomerase